jgi:hypothetical protein
MEDNIKMDIEEVECEVWTGSGWLRIGTLVNAAVNHRVP